MKSHENNGKANGALLAGMNDALNREISTIVRYLLQGSSIHGLANEPLRQMYRKEVADELGHAQYLADKIAILGGKAEVHPDLAPPPEDIDKMVAHDLVAEESDIAHYQKLAKMAENAGLVELKLKMEDQAADESRHAEELRRMQASS
jgi:bacterioferritin